MTGIDTGGGRGLHDSSFAPSDSEGIHVLHIYVKVTYKDGILYIGPSSTNHVCTMYTTCIMYKYLTSFLQPTPLRNLPPQNKTLLNNKIYPVTKCHGGNSLTQSSSLVNFFPLPCFSFFLFYFFFFRWRRVAFAPITVFPNVRFLALEGRIDMKEWEGDLG